MRPGAIFIFYSFLFLSCGAWAPQGSSQNVAVPKDEATSKDLLAIERTLELISEQASVLGYQNDFRDIPIVVRASGGQAESVAGRCHFTANGKGHYIELFKDVLELEAPRRSSAYCTDLFIVLLHEIGHCYFHRPHDHAMIKEEGFEMIFQMPSAHGAAEVSYSELPASIMIGSWQVGIPRSLEKYYIAELLGLFRAQTPYDLQGFVKIRIKGREDLGPTAESALFIQ